MSRSRLRLTAALTALVAVAMGIAGVYAESRVRAERTDGITRRLAREAGLTRELVAHRRLEAAAAPELDAIADAAGRATGARVTLMGPEGAVVGDSDVPLERLADIENHAARPEVRTALAGERGIATRRSGTVGSPLLYVALPVDGGRGGVVRVARGLEQLDAAVASLRRDLARAGAIGLFAAVLLAYALAGYALRPLGEIQRLTEAVAGGDLDERPARRFGDELGGIADAIRRLADQLQQRLAETTDEKERLRAVLDGMTEGVLVIDPAGEIVLANERVRALFDAPGPLVGRTALAGIRNAELADLLAEAWRKGEPMSRVIGVLHPAPRSLRVQAVRFPAGAATATGTVAVFHDVTELTQLESMRREFVANASHELRTPLAAIRGFTETLLGADGLPHDEQRSHLEVIDRHARRLGRLIDDLLELSRIESGKSQPEFETVDVALLCTRLAREFEPRCRERELTLECDVAASPPAWTDAGAVEQILTNLLDNAIQYTEPGGRIRVAAAGDAHGVRVSVEDTGIGIPEDDLGRIFERFYRVDKARSRALGGTGLGLAIVKHLVQTLGGEIQVTSRIGRGTRFRFTLRPGCSR